MAGTADAAVEERDVHAVQVALDRFKVAAQSTGRGQLLQPLHGAGVEAEMQPHEPPRRMAGLAHD